LTLIWLVDNIKHQASSIKHQVSLHNEVEMRTTLTIEDDVFIEAKQRALAEKRSIGSVVSDLVRRALQSPEFIAAEQQARAAVDARLLELGVTPYYATGGRAISNKEVNKFREDLDI
jgi:hypothetical protein